MLIPTARVSLFEKRSQLTHQTRGEMRLNSSHSKGFDVHLRICQHSGWEPSTGPMEIPIEGDLFPARHWRAQGSPKRRQYDL